MNATSPATSRSRSRRLPSLLALALAGAALGWGDPALAQQRRAEPLRWNGHIERFHDHDWRLWRDGRWVHGVHGGRRAWWWVVGTGPRAYWYFYPAPIYPYPSPWEPPVVSIVLPSLAGMPPPPQYWYFCESAGAYYPYVASCAEAWKQVPATPEAPAR